MRIALLIGIMAFVISCNKKANPVSESKPVKAEAAEAVDYAKENYISATVVDMRELDGCRFMLKLENGKKLQPVPSLSENFSVNDMTVWIKFQVKKGAVGICMSGQIVTLTDIQKR